MAFHCVFLSEIHKNCFVKLKNIGVKIRCVTCDGTAANVQALNSLGGTVSPLNLNPFFEQLSLDVNVYAI